MIYRNYFGAWGRDLSTADFACALAALGVLDRRRGMRTIENPEHELSIAGQNLVRPLEWRFYPIFMARMDMGEPTSARTLAEAWKNSGLMTMARLEVDRSSAFPRVDSMAMLPWIVSELSRPEVGARSVYLRVDRPSVTVGWRWPLTVGLLDDEESREVRSRLERVVRGESWMEPLVRFVDVQSAPVGCDLLVIPSDIRKSLAVASALPAGARADCVVVLGHTEGDAAHWHRMVEGLRASVRTSGVAIARQGTDDIETWFMSVVRELSHNRSIDVALYSAAGTARPFIAISRRLAEFSRISMQLRRKAKAMRRPGVRDVTLDIEPGSAASRTLDIGPGTHTLESVADSLETAAVEGESAVDPGGFIHERDAATGSAMLDERVEMATASASSAAVLQEERFIQAQAFDLTDPEKPVRRVRSLRAGAKHQIVVRIGAPDSEFISPESGPGFPVDALPQDQDEWELTAVLSVAQSDDEPQMSKLILPRFGNSSLATFFVFVKEEWRRVEARIVILHRNRVIQTAMLDAVVGGVEDVAARDRRITVAPEVVARTRFDNLDTRDRFDAALVMNRSSEGIERLLAISDDRVARFTPGPTMGQVLGSIDDLLTEIVDDPKLFMGKVTSKPVVGLLRKLARKGAILHDHIVKDGGLEEVGFHGTGPIQLISAVPDARLPIELVYSQKAPSETAKMCPGAATSLRKGKCRASCTKRENQSDFICPLAFWGVQRVIERHAHRPKLDKVTAGRDFAVVAEPTDLRPELQVLRGGLIAGSQKVAKTVQGGLEDICALVGRITNSTLEPIPDWKTWKKSVGKTGPSLLVLIVHTEESDDDDTIPQMEIGTSWLSAADIEEEHVVRENGDPPLVLLLGCETGVPDKQFANFVSRLRHCRAAIVVATGAKIHSTHAVPVAKEFIARIEEASAKPGATFGSVMLAVRREMLAKGMPMVLTLNAFGDADWRLAKH